MPAQSAPVPFPAAFGHWQLRGGTLVCRLPRKTVQVRAPANLLRQVLALCDGQLAWKAVAAELAQRWSSRDVDRFLSRLSAEGVLVDAAELLPRWLDLGQAPGLFTPIDPPAAWPALERAADLALAEGAAPVVLSSAGAQFADLLRARRSERTFGDDAVDADTLRSILWAAGGTTRARGGPGSGWHRTTASGGNMHGLRWHAIVLRALPDRAGPGALQPGLYEAVFHQGGGCTLRLLRAGGTLAWQILQDPRVLRYASAMVLPIADVGRSGRKYGNRAAVYALIEAGQALQNAQLMATALQVAGCVRGDASAAAVRDLLQPCMPASSPDHLLPLPTYVVGRPPSAWQAGRQATERWIHLAPVQRLLPEAPAAFLAGPVTAAGTTTSTLGRARDPALAATKAEAEAWERLGWLHLSPCIQGARRDVPNAIDPTELVAYADRQHAAAAFPFRRFDPRRHYVWCPTIDVIADRRGHVPADLVHAPAALPRPQHAGLLTNASTSGVATWTDAQTALVLATLELIERDAFVRAWIARAPLVRTLHASLPASARRRVERMRDLGLRVEVLRLPSPWAPAFAVFAQRHDQPYTGVTAAAHFDRERAVGKALDEAEGRAADAITFRPAPITREAQLQTPRDYHHYYQMPRFHRRADFLAESAACERFGRDRETCSHWPQLLQRCARLGLPLLAVDITPPGASIEQGRTPLHVVRALLPGLLPIWFTHGAEPAGMPAYRQAAGAHADRPARPHPFS